MDERLRELERQSRALPCDPAALADYARAVERTKGRRELYRELAGLARLGHEAATEMLASWSPNVAWSRMFPGGFSAPLLGADFAYVTSSRATHDDPSGLVCMDGKGAT